MFLNSARQTAMQFNAKKNASFQIFTQYVRAVSVLIANYHVEGFSFTHARLLSLKSLESGIERLHSIRTMGMRYFLIGVLTQSEFFTFVRSNKVASDYFVASVVYDQIVERFISRRFGNCSCDITKMAKEIIANKKIQPQIKRMNEWNILMSKQMTAYDLTGDDVHLSLAAIAGSKHNDAIAQCMAELVVLIICLLGFPVCCTAMMKIVNNTMLYVTHLIEKKQRSNFEKRKTDDLLGQMLPKSVVMQLKFHKKVRYMTCIDLFDRT
jgi:hypothetical protein